MGEWTRNTPWRQGLILTEEAIKAAGLSDLQNPDDTVVIVASHDCDLTQSPDREPYIEVIVGHKIPEVDGNNMYAKNPRTLHIEFLNDKSLKCEFNITAKRNIPKELLADFAPQKDLSLAPADLYTFQCWLASRYSRSAFPDEFERRLNEENLTEKIVKAVKPSGSAIKAILFDVNGGPDREVDDIYLLDIIVLYASEPDAIEAEGIANRVAKKIKDAFNAKLFDKKSGSWRNIELRYIDAISDEVMPVGTAEKYKRWRLDYLSLRNDPEQPIAPE